MLVVFRDGRENHLVAGAGDVHGVRAVDYAGALQLGPVGYGEEIEMVVGQVEAEGQHIDRADEDAPDF